MLIWNNQWSMMKSQWFRFEYSYRCTAIQRIRYPRLYMHQKGAPLETDVSICAIGGLKEFTSSEYEHHGNHQGPHGTHHEWLLTEIGPIVSVNPR